jgi:hypothetical protein
MDEIEEQIKGVGGVVGGDMDDVLLCVPTGRAVALMAKFKANRVPLHLEEVPEKGQWFIQDPELASFHEDAAPSYHAHAAWQKQKTRAATPSRDTASKWLDGGPKLHPGGPHPESRNCVEHTDSHLQLAPLCRPSGSVPDHQAVPRSPVRVLGQTRVPEHLRRVREDY